MVLMLIFAVIFAACNTREAEIFPEMGGMGMGSGMGQRHHAQVPEPYTGMVNPVPTSEDSLTRGEEIYSINCATCHGDGGMGDGPGGSNLDPLPAPIAHTSQMMADDYFFWRISEGGADFGTAMIPYANILDEQARWAVINYLRALGSGIVRPHHRMGGEIYSEELMATQHAEMLAGGVDQGVISESEAEIFERIHTALETYLETNLTKQSDITMDERQAAALLALVEAGTISQNEAAKFVIIHARLAESGLMP